nr:MAG TPA: hypothetical protein [Caudoviricetes sp.]
MTVKQGGGCRGRNSPCAVLWREARAYFPEFIKKGLTRENKLENIWARGRKKRRGALEKGLAEKEKTALYVGAAAVACGCRRS